MKSVLVTGASGIVGYGILRSLRKAGQDLRLIGSSIYDDSAAQGFCDLFELAPQSGDPSYINWLKNTINHYKIDLIIPGIELDVFTWVEQLPSLEKTGTTVMLNNPELIRLCRDKWLFYKRLKQAGISCAIPSSLDDRFDSLKKRFGLPFLLKPRQGYGSKGLVTVTCEADFNLYRHGIGPILMAQPIVGRDDAEYTTSAFCDGRGGFHACMTLRRRLSRDGFTEKAEVTANDDFADTILELCRIFQPVGPTNFQFRRCIDGIKLLEINPRVSSSTSIRTAFGYNECAMAVDYFLDQVIPSQPEITRGKAVRYTDEVIFYEDGLHL